MITSRLRSDLVEGVGEKKKVRTEMRTSRQFLVSAFDSLSANIAILDEVGTIVAVNQSWRRFADENGLNWPDYGVGRNYLAAVETASGGSSPRAAQTAAVMRELIAGQRSHFYLEYPCHSPTEKRWFEMRATRFRTGGDAWMVITHENITQRKQADLELRRMTRALTERVKELNCLYGISRLAGQQGVALEEILQGTVELIPPAWHFPEVTCARITLNGHEFKTDNFQESIWRQSADLIVRGECLGVVEVCYLEERPAKDEGPFLKEERKLLDAIAERLSRVTERLRAEEALRDSEALLREAQALANVGNFHYDLKKRRLIWSEQLFQIYGLDPNLPPPTGDRHKAIVVEEDWELVSSTFEQSYPTREPIDIEYRIRRSDGTTRTLHSISNWNQDANGEIASLSGVVQDITERKQVERALQEAKEAAVAARYEEQERLREAERRRQIAEGLGDVLAALNSNQSLEEVLDLIATQARRLLDTRAVGIYSLGSEVGTLAIEASKGLLIAYVAGSNIPIGQESLRQAMLSSQPVAVTDVAAFPSDDSLLASDVRRQASAGPWADLYRAWLAVPIFSKNQVYGGILLYYAEPRVFFEDEVELAVAFADQAALAIENSRLRDQIELAAASAERDRLARDLHDAVTQTLFSASLIADALPRVWDSRPEEAQRGLEELRHLTRGALAEMRTMLVELRPASLTEKPLSELLRHLTEAVTSRTRVPVALTIEGDSPLEPNLQVALYRIAQEALNNVAKHAGAGQAGVDLRYTPAHVTLQIIDDGCGFDPGNIRPDRIGMGIMRERAKDVGAVLKIDSQPGRGTRVTVDWQDTRGEGGNG